MEEDDELVISGSDYFEGDSIEPGDSSDDITSEEEL